MNDRSRSRLALAASLLLLAIAVPSEAGMQHRMSAETLAPLSAPLKVGAKLKIARVPLIDGEEATLELERFQVWADNAEIEVFGAGQEVVERVSPPAVQYFRGRVAGHPESLVFLSTGARGTEGLIWVADRKFALGSERGSIVVQESSAIDDIPLESETFMCELEGAEIQRPPRPHAITDASGVPVSQAAPAGTQRSVINLAVETDSELFAKVSSSPANMTTYIGNLIAAVSTIYERDLKTEVRIVYLGMQNSAATDVFNITPGASGLWNGSTVQYTASHAMYQLGDRWALNPPTANKYSAATLISGTSAGAGVGWLGTLCDGAFLCGNNCGSAAASGHHAGPFSFNGGITPPANLSAPNPDANVNFVAGSGYWPLLQVSHELGHNVGSGHTHCIKLSDTQKTQYNVTRSYVDECFNGQSGCFAGTVSVPAEKGSIMSYCHLRSGGGSNTRYTFGQPSETSEIVKNNMLANIAGVTPAMSSIAAPSSLEAGASGNASVTNAGHTYSWQIVNGTFAGGNLTASGASVSFSGTANPVLLTVTATNAAGCAVTDTKSVSIIANLEAPQGLVATPSGETSVGLVWTGVENATGYEIFRSALGTGFVSIGTSAEPSFHDTGAAAGTAYLYRVRATAGGTTGPFSNFDLATATVFTDATLTAGATGIKLAHFTELQSAVNAVRALAGLGTAPFTAPAPATNVTVRRVHVLDLRTALDAARGVLGLPPLSYTDAAITAGTTRIKAAHISELRTGVQ